LFFPKTQKNEEWKKRLSSINLRKMNYSLIIYLSCFLDDICSCHYRYLNIASATMRMVAVCLPVD